MKFTFFSIDVFIKAFGEIRSDLKAMVHEVNYEVKKLEEPKQGVVHKLRRHIFGLFLPTQQPW